MPGIFARCSCLLLSISCLGIVPSAQADETVGLTKRGVELSADGGVAAWRSDAGLLVVRFGGRTPQVTPVHLPKGDLDVGRRPGGGARLVYATSCSKVRRSCALRGIDLAPGLVAAHRLRSRVLTRIPYGDGPPVTVSIDGDTVAYALPRAVLVPGCDRGVLRCIEPYKACDVPYVRRIDARQAIKLDRGDCGDIVDLDLAGGNLAALVWTEEGDDQFSEARVITTSGGRSRRLQRERQSRSGLAGANEIGAIALDGGLLFTTTLGDEQLNRFSRFSLRTGQRVDARAFTLLDGSYARDGGRQLYGIDPAGNASLGFRCAADTRDIPCQVVAGSDPFSVRDRLLPPAIHLSRDPQKSVPPGTPVDVVVRVVRKRVARNALAGLVPVVGVPVELVGAVYPDEDSPPYSRRLSPTGRVQLTDPTGTTRFSVINSGRSALQFTARLRSADGPAVVGSDIEVAGIDDSDE